ncbi:MAG: L,D-transpeptidase family protein [Allosphingosinicella sp.]
MRLVSPLIAALAFLAASGCQQSDQSGQQQAANQQSGQQAAADPQAEEARRLQVERELRQQQAEARRQGLTAEQRAMQDEARRETGALRFVVDKSDRKVRVYRGNEVIRTHDVAVGDAEHETPSGEWEFHRVDLNPEWNPPDSEWAEDRTKKAPGDPENPMGRARLVFNMPYTIHGTDATNSLGKAVSHGSIRVSNENVVELAELLLRSGGAWEGDAWFKERTGNRKTEYQIPLNNPVPIEVVD